MSDVFISYSRTDRALAQALADDLTGRGVDVWWDLELYAGQDFHDAILAALDACKAVIVIWSAAAARSPWVRDEASRAARDNKLITTHAPGFDLAHIPLGMGQRQCEDVTDRAAIIKALGKLEVSLSKFAATQGAHNPEYALTDDQLLEEQQQPRFRRADLDLTKSLYFIEAVSPTWHDKPNLLTFLSRLHRMISSRTYTDAVRERIAYLALRSMQEINAFPPSQHRVHILNSHLQNLIGVCLPRSERRH